MEDLSDVLHQRVWERVLFRSACNRPHDLVGERGGQGENLSSKPGQGGSWPDGDSGSPRIWATNPRILGPDPVWTTYPGILGPDPESGPPTLGFFWSRPVELYALRLPGGIALLNTEC